MRAATGCDGCSHGSELINDGLDILDTGRQVGATLQVFYLLFELVHGGARRRRGLRPAGCCYR